MLFYFILYNTQRHHLESWHDGSGVSWSSENPPYHCYTKLRKHCTVHISLPSVRWMRIFKWDHREAGPVIQFFVVTLLCSAFMTIQRKRKQYIFYTLHSFNRLATEYKQISTGCKVTAEGQTLIQTYTRKSSYVINSFLTKHLFLASISLHSSLGKCVLL